MMARMTSPAQPPAPHPVPPARHPEFPTRFSALAPLLERYAAWLRMDTAAVLADREEDPAAVRAIQILLHLPKGDPVPSWHAALAAASSGCAALCLDQRAAPGGPWFQAVLRYCEGHIRKVTRRGRGAQWEATADLDGITLTAGESDAPGATAVRVLVPGLVGEVDKRVAKLQVGGTDVPVDAEPVVVRAPVVTDLPADAVQASPDLEVRVPTGERAQPMTAGKLMAQAGHAGMLAAGLLAATNPGAAEAWAAAGCPARLVRADDAAWEPLLTDVADPSTAWREHGLIAVRDAGFTEITPGTVTAIARFA